MSNYLNVREVALMFKVNAKTVYRHIDDIPGHFKMFGNHFFDKKILLDYIAQQAKPNPRTKSVNLYEDKHGLF